MKNLKMLIALLSGAALLTAVAMEPVHAAGVLPAISAGNSHNVTLKATGILYAWGDNTYGQLGDGTSNGSLDVLKAVGTGYTAIDAGGSHSVALKTDGSLWTWGSNISGQLGDGLGYTLQSPKQIGTGYTSIAAGGSYTLAIKTDGSLWAWGANSDGQLGVGSTANSQVPKQVGTGFAVISAGLFHSLAIKTDGSLWAWGSNSDGQLGDGTTTTSNLPKQIGTGFNAIAAGQSHSVALKSDGSLWAWGTNWAGHLGDGTTKSSLVPKQIGTGYVAIAAGMSHTMALKTDGSLWVWGGNSDNQLGDGGSSSSLVPKQIGTGYTLIAARSGHSMGVKATGSLWVWGKNVGTYTTSRVPKQVDTGYLVPDTTPPSVPLAVSATAISASQISLSWSAAADVVGVSNYHIYRDGVLIGSTAATTFVDAALPTSAASTAYRYAVVACDAAANCSAPSTSALALNTTVTTTQSDCLFDWAETGNESLFAPAGSRSLSLAPYYYRYYSRTAAFLVTSLTDSHLYYVGPLSNNAVLDLGLTPPWLTLAGCANTPVAGQTNPFATQPVTPTTTSPETKSAITSVAQSTPLTLSDGSALTLPATTVPANATLQRQANTLAPLVSGFDMSGSVRTVTLSTPSSLPEDYRLDLVIPAKEVGAINPDTVQVARIADLLKEGQVIKDAVIYLSVRRNNNGDLLVSDPLVANALDAARVAALATGLPSTRDTSAASSVSIKYAQTTYQNDLNWLRQPALVRMVNRPGEKAKRVPLSTLSAEDQARELKRCSQNIIVLVHGHNETEKDGYVGVNVLNDDAPWFFSPKKDTWTLFYDQYQLDYPSLLSESCTVFYEYIYPTYRSIFSGYGNLGDDFAARLATELKPLFDKTTNPNLFIVAHSMGGLVARAGIQKFSPDLHTAFQKLVTWGSPHHGSVVSSFRSAFGGPYGRVKGTFTYLFPVLSGLTQIVVTWQAIGAQLDTPGARDLRWDNIKPLRLDETFWLPPNNPSDYSDAAYTAMYNLKDGTKMYSVNTRALNANDVYRDGTKLNRLSKNKYGFLYGLTSKYISNLCKADICLGSSITYGGIANPASEYLPGIVMGANDGAGPAISMMADGVAGDRLAVGDIDHEEYFGAPSSPGVFEKRAKAITVSGTTLGALQLGDPLYKCPILITDFSPNPALVGTTVTITGTGFGVTRGVVTIGGVSASITNWTDTSITATVPTNLSTRSADVVVNSGGVTSNTKTVQIIPLAAVINNVSPNPVMYGGTITISGSGFGSDGSNSKVVLGSRYLPCSPWTDTSITCELLTFIPAYSSGYHLSLILNGYSGIVDYGPRIIVTPYSYVP